MLGTGNLISREILCGSLSLALSLLGHAGTLELKDGWQDGLGEISDSKSEFVELFSSHGKANEWLDGDSKIVLYGGITYLMAVKAAEDHIRRSIPSLRVSKTAPIQNPVYPKDSFNVHVYEGAFEGGCNQLYLITDKADQVASVMLVETRPKANTRYPTMLGRLDWKIVNFNHSESKQSAFKVYHEVKKPGKGQVLMRTVSGSGLSKTSNVAPIRVSGTMNEVNYWYLAQPLVDFLLYYNAPMLESNLVASAEPEGPLQVNAPWGLAPPGKFHANDEFIRLFQPYGKARTDAVITEDLEIYRGVKMMMPLSEAVAILGVGGPSTSRVIGNTAFPSKSFIAHIYNGDYEYGCDQLVLITNNGRVVSLELVDEDASGPVPRDPRIADIPGAWRTVDFASSRLSGSTTLRNHRYLLPSPKDVRLIMNISASVKSGGKEVNYWYLPQPMVDLLLYHNTEVVRKRLQKRVNP